MFVIVNILAANVKAPIPCDCRLLSLSPADASIFETDRASIKTTAVFSNAWFWFLSRKDNQNIMTFWRPWKWHLICYHKRLNSEATLKLWDQLHKTATAYLVSVSIQVKRPCWVQGLNRSLGACREWGYSLFDVCRFPPQRKIAFNLSNLRSYT